jgi:predicted RNA-binding Zn-ribbon protein involved in translation (DUF1610 family)
MENATSTTATKKPFSELLTSSIMNVSTFYVARYMQTCFLVIGEKWRYLEKMSVIQVIECLKCGNKETIRDKRDPWEAWPKGCPKCGHRKVDVYVILDKQDRVSNANVIIKKLINP